jgi:hypothetical protein
MILGALSKLLNYCSTPSLAIYLMNKFHMVLGYALTLLCKIQNYYILDKNALWFILLSLDIIFFVLLIIRKIWSPKMSDGDELKYTEEIK